MTGWLLLLALGSGVVRPDPDAVVIATAAGEQRIPLWNDPRLGPLLPGQPLAAALGGVLRVNGLWVELRLRDVPFRFLIEASVYEYQGSLFPLSAGAAVRRDTVYLPLQFLAEVLPDRLAPAYRWDGVGHRLAVTAAAPAEVARRTGRRPARHLVAIDPGHGGVDPGNPGLAFPRGVREKDVTLQVGLLLRETLERRGIAVRMTRTADTLIDLRDRGGYCTSDCDLFVSLHVNSLPRRAGYTAVRGFETYFLSEAKTEDAARVERMENEAVRFEQIENGTAPVAGLDFILKDLAMNEHLRESARFAALVQDHLAAVHSGEDRGVKQAGFMVLTTARRPAVLVELGYGTNAQDGKLLTTPKSQRALAGAIADAIESYLREYDRRIGVGPTGPGGGRE